ncbi:HET-domain-containing protein [Apiospora rasikravindrae]|uniref:HET-domain-containing protein n=1 Tax=Apiospora rasikravindrae TaxID=990691 RepID=A0ABR1RWL3_9PEZI
MAKERNNGQVIKEADDGRAAFLCFRVMMIANSSFHIIAWTPRYGSLGDQFALKMPFSVDWIAQSLREGPEKLGSYTGGPATWEYVKGRLDNCARTHPECQDSSPWVPTRLLEVTTKGPATRLRVVLTKKWTEKKRYISLSHQWGTGPTILRLTKATYDLYRDRIPTKDLPRKYVDAIQAAQQLGVLYLWIDSLCIIQDDEDDWAAESAQMHRVYRHAFCNLSAASSSSANEGLFYNRDAKWLQPHVIIPGNNNIYPVVVTQPGRDTEWHARLDKEPLYSRAWVCQERLLATRNVSYARHLVYFECAKEMSSELSKGEHGAQAKSFRSRRNTYGEQPLSLRTLGEHPSPHDAWKTIVEYYSGCDLTYPTDKLVAISGVARVFRESFQPSTYLAGLWSDNLLEGLAWQRSSTQSRRPRGGGRYAEYLAPSWSWVSINAQVDYKQFSYGGYEYQPLADIDNVRVVPHLWTDPFGRVRSGSLRLRCYVIPLQLDYDEFRTRTSLTGREFELQVARAAEKLVQTHESLNGFTDCKLDNNSRDSRDHKGVQVAEGARYYAMPLLTQLKPDATTRFLILESLTPTWGLYRRVGLLHLTPRNKPEFSTSLESHNDNNHSDVGGDMPAICQEGQALGIPFEHCRVLARMIRASEEVEVPALERIDEGRCLITII